MHVPGTGASLNPKPGDGYRVALVLKVRLQDRLRPQVSMHGTAGSILGLCRGFEFSGF